MQFYHHPLSLRSQQARLALEEKGIDYWPISVNPVKARNLDADYFREHPNGEIPVLINGNRVLRGSLAIVQYIDNFNQRLGGDKVDRDKVEEWLEKLNAWDSEPFTLSHIPAKYLLYHSKFKRQVLIARMAENPELATKYHAKLHEMHALEERLKDEEAIAASKEQLVSLLEEADAELSETNNYLAGEEFSMADAMLLPLLARVEVFEQERTLIHSRAHLSVYWSKVKLRPSYKITIGQYAHGIGKLKLLLPSILNVATRTVFRHY